MNQPPANEHLVCFFVFNPTITYKEEKQHENILYYYPSTNDLNTQMNDFGLSTAFSGLTERFTQEALGAYSTDHTRTALISPEKDYWLSATVKRSITEDSELALEESYMDAALQALMRHGHALFSMHNNTFQGMLAAHGREKLCAAMREFFDVFMLLFLRILGAYDPLLDAMESVTYLAADRTQFLSMLSLLNKLKYASPDSIDHCVVLVDDCVLYSELDPRDTLQLARYVARRKVRRADSSATGQSHPADNLLRLSHTEIPPTAGGGFVNTDRATKLWLRTPVTGEGEGNGPLTLRQHPLMIYTYGKTYILFVLQLKGSCPCNTELIAITIRSNLSCLSNLQDCVLRSSAWDESYTYIYFNQTNMALKTSVRRHTSIPDLLLYAEAAHQLFSGRPSTKEICIRAKDNVWVVCMKSDQREFFLIFDKAQTISEVADEVKRISSVFFHGIFL